MTEKVIDLSDGPRITPEQAELLLQWCQEECPDLYARWAALELADQSLGLLVSEVMHFIEPHLKTDDPSKRNFAIFTMSTEIRRRHGARGKVFVEKATPELAEKLVDAFEVQFPDLWSRWCELERANAALNEFSHPIFDFINYKTNWPDTIVPGRIFMEMRKVVMSRVGRRP